MVTILFQQGEEFFLPHFNQFCIRQRGGMNHQPRPSTFKANTDTIFVSSSHPKFIPRSGVGTSDIYVAGLHQLHESISQIQVVRSKSKRNVIATPQPISITVQKEQAFLHFKSTEAGSL